MPVTYPLSINPTLKRYPPRKRELLQAWDSADELLLEHLSSMDLVDRKILIMNDSFGALGCALQPFAHTSVSDSFVSLRATELNSKGKVNTIDRLDQLAGPYDLVVARVPRNLSYFEDQLCQFSHHLKPGADLVIGYMVKYQTKTAFDLLNRIIGPTTTSLAKKKARLIFAKYKKSPTPSPYPTKVVMDGFPEPFLNHSNVFSREKLDIGARFLLDHLPSGDYRSILDLGCANGVIGIAAKRHFPSAELIFTDESRMAIQSAEVNFRTYFGGEALAKFHFTHCADGVADESVDLVLCNPPFHQGNTLTDVIAQQMFEAAKRVLVPGGKLRIVGNLHLHYPATLARIFGESEVIAKNQKFAIVDAIK